MNIRCAAALATLLVLCALPHRAAAQPPAAACERTIEADIVAIDQPIFLNRLGASMPGGMIYALRREIVAGANSAGIVAGNAQLDPNRRPRPLVLRARVGDCLHVKFQNLLSPTALGPSPAPAGSAPACNANDIYPEQTCTRSAGVHVVGMDEQVLDGRLMDGSFVGANRSSLAAPSERIDYVVRAPAEGVFLMYSAAGPADRAVRERSTPRRSARSRAGGSGDRRVSFRVGQCTRHGDRPVRQWRPGQHRTATDCPATAGRGITTRGVKDRASARHRLGTGWYRRDPC